LDLPAIWHGSRQHRRDRINELRMQFDYVLIDCPSLRTNGDVLGIAPLVDGVLLVVEANRTRADQVLYAERQIQTAGGVFRGHILNKRKYFVPQWLYQRLSQN
jgi:Mrp family chromosome partitioning ATPase